MQAKKAGWSSKDRAFNRRKLVFRFLNNVNP